MIVVTVASCVVAIASMAAMMVTRRRLADQRRRTLEAEAAVAARSAELVVANAAIETAELGRIHADQRAVAAEHATAVAEQRAELAEQLAARADQRATVSSAGFDPEVVWALEQARSERTWRLSLALGPDLDSVFVNAASPLREALQVEVDAAREEVGAVVELDAYLPDGLTQAGSVLVLRAAQELLATVVRRGEETTVDARPDGRDMLVTIRSVDENGEPVPPSPLPLPDSPGIEAIDDGVRIRNVVSVPVGADPTRA